MRTIVPVSAEGKARTGREYLRVSLDRSGRQRSIDEQHNENQQAAADRGVTLGAPYRDESISASRYSRKTRDGFGQLLTDLEKGRFGADELWLWESSRGSRKVAEWVTLIELCEQQRVKIHVTTHGRTYDPANGRDRRSLIEDATDAEYESSKISVRAKRAAAANAAAGKPHGRAPYGYGRRYDERTRKMIAQVPDPIEAPVIRELFERVKSGHSLRSIARDFEGRGIRTRSGKVFSPQHLRVLATTAAYAGLRVHDSEGRGAGRGHSPQPGTPGVSVVKGTWEPLVSEATYRAVQRLLNDPKRVTTRPGRAVHLLSGIAVCDKCGGPIFATFRYEVASYQCRKGCIRIQKADIEELAKGIILAYLARPDVHQVLSRAEADSDALHAVRNELAAARGRLAELADAAATGTISIATVARAEPQILATIGVLERREAELATPSALHGFITPGADVARRWSAAPMSTRREIARLLLVPDMLGELRVMPRPAGWPGGRHVPAYDRVVWRRA
jgi:DNA invertase Pin-like site-specific DNA recombinase